MIDATEAKPEAARSQPSSTEQSGLQGVARQTVLYGIGMMAAKALSFIMLPVYTRFLSPGDYGVMELINMTLDVVTIIAGAQMVSGLYRFYHKAASSEERDSVISTGFLLFGCTFGVMGLLAILLAPQLSEMLFDTRAHTISIRLAAATIVLTPTITVPSAYLRVRNEAGLLVSSGLAKLGIAAALNVILLLRGWGIQAIFASGLVATTLIGGSLTIRMLHHTGMRVSGAATRSLVRYGLPLVVTNIATFLFTFGDRFFLQAAGDETVVGLYMMAYQFGFLLVMVGSAPFAAVWQPRRFEVANRDDRHELYARGFVYANLMLLPVAAGIILFIDDFFRIMTTPAFYPAAQYVPVIVIAYVFQSWVGIQDIGVLVKERTELIAVANWIAAGLAVVGYALLVPRYLAWGAAWTTLGTMLIRYLMVFGFSQRLWHVRYNWAPVVKLVALASVTATAGLALPDMPLLSSVASRVVIFALFLALVWNAGILTPTERTAVAGRAIALRRALIRVSPTT